MKVVLCSWCDKAAQYKRTLDGECTNSDACCGEHFVQHFAKHSRSLVTLDLPMLGLTGGKHKAPVVVGSATGDDWLLA